jgi:hypothetical protein
MDKNLIVCLLLAFPPTSCVIYGQKFIATAVVGLNAAQIDGDSLYGFKKAGIHVGGRVSYINNKSFDLALEMLYSQRGSSRLFSNNKPADLISANYVEFPLVINLRDWYIQDKQFFKIRAELGLSYGYLVGIKSEKYDVNRFNKHDVSWLLGCGMRFTPFWGLGLRYTTSFSNMYKDQAAAIEKFKSYFLTFRSEFYF